jgi:Ni,Fe-hydrogenase I small subunit
MDRRQFLQICGCAGAGLMIGAVSVNAGSDILDHDRWQAQARRRCWMHGSAATGCARLPHVEPPRSGDMAVQTMEFL